MNASQEDTTQENKQHIRLLELASGGPLYTEMLKNTTEPSMYDKELGNPLEDMRFL